MVSRTLILIMVSVIPMFQATEESPLIGVRKFEEIFEEQTIHFLTRHFR